MTGYRTPEISASLPRNCRSHDNRRDPASSNFNQAEPSISPPSLLLPLSFAAVTMRAAAAAAARHPSSSRCCRHLIMRRRRCLSVVIRAAATPTRPRPGNEIADRGRDQRHDADTDRSNFMAGSIDDLALLTGAAAGHVTAAGEAMDRLIQRYTIGQLVAASGINPLTCIYPWMTSPGSILAAGQARPPGLPVIPMIAAGSDQTNLAHPS